MICDLLLLFEKIWVEMQLVLELRSDGSVVTSDDPPVVLGTVPSDFVKQVSPFSLTLSELKVCKGEGEVVGSYFRNLKSDCVWYLKGL